MEKKIFRKIGKSAAAYLVGGIAFIQLAPVFFDTFPPEPLLGVSPELLMQYLFAIVAIGFPIVLLMTFISSKSSDDVTNTEEIKVTASGDYKQKIAVIPFANLNKDDDGAFLVDGSVEDLITELSMISEIEIVSRQTCFNRREENLSHQDYRMDLIHI